MNFYEFEAILKRFECLSSPIPYDNWIVLHVDGDNFHSFVKRMNYERPFDKNFHEQMEEVGKYLLKQLNGIFAYLQSDEINLLLHKDCDLFNRNLVKIVSKSVSLASSFFNTRLTKKGERVGFATHLYSLPNIERVIDYFRWRMSDCFRNCFNAYCYWEERKNGLSPNRATKKFENYNLKEKIQFIHDLGIVNIPEWQKFGTMIAWESYEKNGYNPKTNEDVIAIRKRIKINKNLPNGDLYRDFLLEKIN